MKKLIALLLALVMIIGLVACGKTDAPSADDTKPSADAPAKDDEPAKEDPATITIMLIKDSSERWEEHLKNTLQPLWLEELNLNVNFEYRQPGDYELSGTMAQAGEDFCWQEMFGNSPSWFVPDGVCAQLDEAKLREYAPALIANRESIGNTLADCYVDGALYGVPLGLVRGGGSAMGFSVRNDILNQLGMDYTDLKTYDDLIEAMKKVKEAFPEMTFGRPDIISTTPWCSDGKSMAVQTIMKSFYAMVNDYDPDDNNIYSYYESEEWLNHIDLMNEWHEMGFIDENSMNDGYALEQWNSGNSFMYHGDPMYIRQHTLTNVPEADVQVVYLYDIEKYPPVSYVSADWPMVFSQEAAKHQEDYFRFFNWIHEDPANYMLFAFGEEGIDYTLDETGTPVIINEFPIYTFTVNHPDAWPQKDLKVYPADEQARYDEFMDLVVTSKLTGFNFMTSNVEEQLMACEAILSENRDKFALGLEPSENWQPVLDQLIKAGLHDIIDEYERQFRAFRGLD